MTEETEHLEPTHQEPAPNDGITQTLHTDKFSYEITCLPAELNHTTFLLGIVRTYEKLGPGIYYLADHPGVSVAVVER